MVQRTISTFNAPAALGQCDGPVLTISSARAMADAASLLDACPWMTLGQTIVGSGHFAQLEVPEQVNPMIERFLAVVGCGLARRVVTELTRPAGDQAQLTLCVAPRARRLTTPDRPDWTAGDTSIHGPRMRGDDHRKFAWTTTTEQDSRSRADCGRHGGGSQPPRRRRHESAASTSPSPPTRPPGAPVLLRHASDLGGPLRLYSWTCRCRTTAGAGTDLSAWGGASTCNARERLDRHLPLYDDATPDVLRVVGAGRPGACSRSGQPGAWQHTTVAHDEYDVDTYRPRVRRVLRARRTLGTPRRR